MELNFSMNPSRFMGADKADDFNQEIYTYRFGSDNQMPIALFLLIASGMKNVTPRYCSLFTHTKKAYEWAEKFDDKLNEQLVDELRKIFEKNSDYVTKDSLNFSIMDDKKHLTIQERIENIPQDIILPLHLYAKQFAQYFAMITYSFETLSQSTVMTCPLSYISFWNRSQFKEVNEVLNNAITHIMYDVIRVMKIKGMEVNSHTMTVKTEGYKAIVESEYYGW